MSCPKATNESSLLSLDNGLSVGLDKKGVWAVLQFVFMALFSFYPYNIL